MSITPTPPAVGHGVRFEQRSVLGGILRDCLIGARKALDAGLRLVSLSSDWRLPRAEPR